MKRRFSLLCVLFIPFLVIAQEKERDTTTIKEVMIVENRLQIPFNKQSRNIQIIEKQEIQHLPVRSLNEVLTYISGVDVRQRGPFGTQADISIDGGLFDQTLILLNGVKVSDIQSGHHSMNIPVNLDAIERIEVLKGPAARVYGINALTGAINVITSLSDNNKLIVDLQSGTSFESKDKDDGTGIYAGTNAQLVMNVGNLNLRNLISIGYNQSNGIRYNSNAEDKRFFYQGKYQFSHHNNLEWMFGYIDNAFGANGYYATPGDRESYEIVKTFIGSLGSIHRLGEHFVLKPRISYRNNKDDYRYYRNDLTKGRSEHQTDAVSLEINSLLHTSSGDVGFGFESRSEKIVSTNIGVHHRYNHGLFAEYKTEAIDNMYLNAGVYINYNTQYGWQVFPGIDASYLLFKNFKASFNIGTSQRLPSYTDLYLSQPKNIGNQNLVPEKAWQYEASLRYFNEYLHIQSGYFRRSIDSFIDWIAVDSDLVFQAQNLGSNKIEGINVNAGYKAAIGSKGLMKVDLSYNYLNPKKQIYEEGLTSKYILESLKNQVIGRIQYNYATFDIGLTNRWVQRELNDPYFIMDVKVGCQFNNWKLYAATNNLLDTSYKEIGTILLPGRWFSLGLRWNLNSF